MTLGMKITKSPEEIKAWSQNIGHEDVMTSFRSYGEVSEHRQSEIIHHLSLKDDGPSVANEELADMIVERIEKNRLSD